MIDWFPGGRGRSHSSSTVALCFSLDVYIPFFFFFFLSTILLLSDFGFHHGLHTF